MIVTGRNVTDQRTENIEGGAMALLDLALDVHFDLVHGYMTGTFDHDLCPSTAGTECEFPHHRKLAKLRFIARIMQAARTKSVTE